METNKAIVGIDLGTTMSVIAVLDEDGKPKAIPNREGDFLTDSVVAFLEGDVIVGRDAKNAAVAYGDRVFSEAKRHMDNVTEDGTPVPIGEVDGKEYTAPVISGFTLKRLKDDGEAYLGCEIEGVIITVPAYFKDTARQATRAAGEIAGLKVERLINEPTAAAIAHGLNSGGEKTVLVYDFGGGTLDCTIIRVSGNTFDVIATKGDSHLGGTDIDNLIIDAVADGFKKDHGIELDPLEDAATLQDSKDKATRTKEALSSRKKSVISVGARGKQITMEITREKLDEMAMPIYERTMDITAGAIEDAGLTPGDIDEFIMVGGSSRIPAVRDLFTQRFGEPVTASVEPDLAIAKGAAILAGNLDIQEGVFSAEGSLSRPVVLDVTAHTLGVEAVDPKTGKRTISAVILRNNKIPAEAERMYMLEKDLQSRVRIKICQGEERTPTDSEDCEVVGELVLDKLPRQAQREKRIRVKFRYNQDGIIEAEAEDIVSGKSTDGRIDGRAGMNDKDIQDAQDDVEGSLMS